MSAIETIIALNNFNNEFNIKFVEFLQNRINFVFTQPRYNFTCGYDDVNELELVINTILVRTKYGCTTAVSDINLNFTVLNNKKLTMTNCPLKVMKTIYSIIDSSRGISNFSYRFDGEGEIDDIKERTDDYIKYGCKPILTSFGEAYAKYLSILFFVLAIVFAIPEINNASNTDLFVTIPFFILAGISFIFDIVLFIDKKDEKKYKRI